MDSQPCERPQFLLNLFSQIFYTITYVQYIRNMKVFIALDGCTEDYSNTSGTVRLLLKKIIKSVCKNTKKEPRFFLVFHWRWKIGQWKKLLGVFLMLNLVDNTLHIIAEQGDKNAELGFFTFLFNMSHFVLPTRITVLLSRIITISNQALCNIIF